MTRHGSSLALRVAALAAAVICAGAAFAADAEKAKDEKEPPGQLYIRADRREFDYGRGIAIVVGNVQFMPPQSDQLIMADAAVVWLTAKEAYLEGNIRIYRTLGAPTEPGEFDVPRPKLTDRTGLEPNESLERAGDIDDIIEAGVRKAILIDTRAAVSEAERLYVNWADGTAYLVKPTIRFAEADRIANWVITAPSVEGIATYRIPVHDKDGKPTGKYERRSHYVAENATFTACTFKHPHTSFTFTHAEMVDNDYAAMKNMMLRFGDVPVLYLPYFYKDLEYDWPWMAVTIGSSSRLGMFASVMFRAEPVDGIKLMPRFEFMAERGVGYGLGAEYHFGREQEIRGAFDVFWVPNDSGTDELADTGRTGSGWPAGWPGGPLGPLPTDLPLGVENRYRIKFTHQQEYPEGVEFDLELHKFSDAGIYREYFENEFKTEKDPETRAFLKYGEDNWAAFVHVKKQINSFITQTEYLPQIGFNMIAQPLGWGFLFTNDTEVARVTTRFAETRRKPGQTNLSITRTWLSKNEYSRPAALTLRESDSDELTGWRFDTVNVVSRPFEWGIFDIEPYVGWRGSWFEHGIESVRGSYAAVTPPIGPALPGAVAAARTHTGGRYRNQVLAGGRIATQFHRTYDVENRPVLRRFFKHGMRHIVTPELFYTYESKPTRMPRHLPENDTVTEQDGLHRITFALRNRWQTKWAEVERDPRAPVGGEWHRRKLAVEKAREAGPVNVVDLDMDIDLFMNPGADNVHPRGRRVRRFSNLRTDLAVRTSPKTTMFLDTEFSFENPGFEVVSAGFAHKPRPNLTFSISHDYHFHDASLLRFAADWDIDPKWSLGFDVQQDVAGGGNWDRTIELTRRFHEWQLVIGYEFDKGKTESIGTISIGPTRSQTHRPSWRFQPRTEQAFSLVESAR